MAFHHNEIGHDPLLTLEQTMNYVLAMFQRRRVMFRAVMQEAAALTSIALFVGMLAIWSQVLGSI